MSAQETAEAFLIVIKRLAKWGLLGFLGLIAIGGVLWAAFWAYEYVTVEIPKAKIQVTVIHPAKELCSTDEYPTFVGAVNKSSKTLLRHTFSIAAREKGRSTDIAAYESYTNDKIIKPGEGYGICIRVIKDGTKYNNNPVVLTGENIEMSVEYFNPTFK